MTPEVEKFIAKAKRKILDIGNATIENDNSHGLELAMELIRLVRSLENQFNDWSEDDTQKYVHYYNVKAKLNQVPMASFINATWGICGCDDEQGTTGPHKHFVADLIDWKEQFLIMFKTMLHDDLQGIKGPGSTHITDGLLECLKGYCTPKGVGNVSLNTDKGVGVLYERGINIAPVILTGAFSLANGEEHLSGRYLRGGVSLEVHVKNAVPPRLVTEPINNTTTFQYQASFRDSGTKTASRTFVFEAPIHFGLLPVGATLVQAQTLPKVLMAKPAEYNAIYGWTTPNDKPVIMIPAEWGEPIAITIGGINLKEKFRIFTGTLPLGGSGIMQNYIGMQWDGNYFEAFDFLMKWQ